MGSSAAWLNLFGMIDFEIKHFPDLTAFLGATRLEEVLPQLMSSNPTIKVPEQLTDHVVELLTSSVKEDVIR